MTDDRFDRELSARLRAYESRLPDAPPPAPGRAGRARNGLPILLAGGTAMLAAIVLVLVVLQGWGRDRVGDPVLSPSPSASATADETAEPSASVTPESTPSPAASETPATPSQSPEPPPAELAWAASGSFPSDGSGPSMVEHIVAVDGGYVAAGVAYDAQLPGVGPTPAHSLRIWLSVDGRTWEPVATQLENVQFTSLVVRADGSLLATGRRGTVNEFGVVESEELAAWTSADGRAWADIDIGMPTVPTTIVAGPQGFIALARPDATEDFELWHSPEATAWTAVRNGVAGRIDVAAGDEGFVAMGTTSATSSETFAIASGDGREWFEASSPPTASWAHVTALDADWIAMVAFGTDGVTETGQTSWSANGLEWSSHGQAPMERITTDGTTCDEYPRHLRSAGGWVVAATALSHPCGEGSFVVHGTQLISSDGAIWTPLPFEVGTPGVSRSGASVNAAVAADGTLILAGENDGVATFWIGEQP